MPTTIYSDIVIDAAPSVCGGCVFPLTQTASEKPLEETSVLEGAPVKTVRLVTDNGFHLIRTQCDAAAIKNFLIWSGLACTLAVGPGEQIEVIIYGR